MAPLQTVNVQAQPLDYINDSARIHDELSPTYFLANEVVETNPSLQQFSGGLVNSGTTGQIVNYLNGVYIHNTYLRTPSVRTFTPMSHPGICLRGPHGPPSK